MPTVVEPGRESATSANQHNEAREDRKNEARRRNKMHEATKGLRGELSRAERSWEKAEEELAQLQNQLGDSSTYEDPELVRALAKRHEELKDNAAGLMEMYETIQRRLVRKEAEFD